MPVFLRWIGRGLLALAGWRVIDEIGLLKKAVVIGAPHTSNWDGLLAILVALALGVRFRWIGKDSLFRFPLGLLMRLLGGIPVDRSTRQNAVQQIAQRFATSETLFVVIAPEGTRKKAPYWKTGFYHMAQAAGVPLAFAYIDYRKKEIGIGKIYEPSGDIRTDMTAIRDFYQSVTPRYPENFGEIILQPPAQDIQR